MSTTPDGLEDNLQQVIPGSDTPLWVFLVVALGVLVLFVAVGITLCCLCKRYLIYKQRCALEALRIREEANCTRQKEDHIMEQWRIQIEMEKCQNISNFELNGVNESMDCETNNKVRTGDFNNQTEVESIKKEHDQKDNEKQDNTLNSDCEGRTVQNIEGANNNITANTNNTETHLKPGFFLNSLLQNNDQGCVSDLKNITKEVQTGGEKDMNKNDKSQGSRHDGQQVNHHKHYDDKENGNARMLTITYDNEASPRKSQKINKKKFKTWLLRSKKNKEIKSQVPTNDIKQNIGIVKKRKHRLHIDKYPVRNLKQSLQQEVILEESIYLTYDELAEMEQLHHQNESELRPPSERDNAYHESNYVTEDIRGDEADDANKNNNNNDDERGVKQEDPSQESPANDTESNLSNRIQTITVNTSDNNDRISNNQEVQIHSDSACDVCAGEKGTQYDLNDIEVVVSAQSCTEVLEPTTFSRTTFLGNNDAYNHAKIDPSNTDRNEDVSRSANQSLKTNKNVQGSAFAEMPSQKKGKAPAPPIQNQKEMNDKQDDIDHIEIASIQSQGIDLRNPGTMEASTIENIAINQIQYHDESIDQPTKTPRAKHNFKDEIKRKLMGKRQRFSMPSMPQVPQVIQALVRKKRKAPPVPRKSLGTDQEITERQFAADIGNIGMEQESSYPASSVQLHQNEATVWMNDGFSACYDSTQQHNNSAEISNCSQVENNSEGTYEIINTQVDKAIKQEANRAEENHNLQDLTTSEIQQNVEIVSPSTPCQNKVEYSHKETICTQDLEDDQNNVTDKMNDEVISHVQTKNDNIVTVSEDGLQSQFNTPKKYQNTTRILTESTGNVSVIAVNQIDGNETVIDEPKPLIEQKSEQLAQEPNIISIITENEKKFAKVESNDVREKTNSYENHISKSDLQTTDNESSKPKIPLPLNESFIVQNYENPNKEEFCLQNIEFLIHRSSEVKVKHMASQTNCLAMDNIESGKEGNYNFKSNNNNNFTKPICMIQKCKKTSIILPIVSSLNVEGDSDMVEQKSFSTNDESNRISLINLINDKAAENSSQSSPPLPFVNPHAPPQQPPTPPPPPPLPPVSTAKTIYQSDCESKKISKANSLGKDLKHNNQNILKATALSSQRNSEKQEEHILMHSTKFMRVKEELLSFVENKNRTLQQPPKLEAFSPRDKCEIDMTQSASVNESQLVTSGHCNFVLTQDSENSNLESCVVSENNNLDSAEILENDPSNSIQSHTSFIANRKDHSATGSTIVTFTDENDSHIVHPQDLQKSKLDFSVFASSRPIVWHNTYKSTEENAPVAESLESNVPSSVLGVKINPTFEMDEVVHSNQSTEKGKEEESEIISCDGCIEIKELPLDKWEAVKDKEKGKCDSYIPQQTNDKTHNTGVTSRQSEKLRYTKNTVKVNDRKIFQKKVSIDLGDRRQSLSGGDVKERPDEEIWLESESIDAPSDQLEDGIVQSQFKIEAKINAYSTDDGYDSRDTLSSPNCENDIHIENKCEEYDEYSHHIDAKEQDENDVESEYNTIEKQTVQENTLQLKSRKEDVQSSPLGDKDEISNEIYDHLNPKYAANWSKPMLVNEGKQDYATEKKRENSKKIRRERNKESISKSIVFLEDLSTDEEQQIYHTVQSHLKRKDLLHKKDMEENYTCQESLGKQSNKLSQETSNSGHVVKNSTQSYNQEIRNEMEFDSESDDSPVPHVVPIESSSSPYVAVKQFQVIRNVEGDF